ncbi:MAG: FixH family protein [Lutibacter sp.]|uniref:FixH family protein n=1 Tax=Lutibacter sp. TaxID=1925666 RepID=UPI00299E25F9|nr:FixH family protein [Lutibacter sp.]MDX1827933.1 FixH family protein [Lutibacter sp.]
MKIKFTWPMGIILALASFMIFILSYVYKATFVKKYDHHLVSEHYYKDELNYQTEIDKLERASNLKQNIVVEHKNNGLLIKFPTEFKASDIKGTINFQRPSNNKLDFQIPINLTENEFMIGNDKLVEGIWDVKIDWYVGKQTFLLKQTLSY